jgi:hypothetical protein
LPVGRGHGHQHSIIRLCAVVLGDDLTGLENRQPGRLEVAMAVIATLTVLAGFRLQNRQRYRLGGGAAGQPSDRHRALGCQDDLEGSDSPGAQLIERQRVVRQEFAGRAVRGDGALEDVSGIGAVLVT